VEMARNGGNYLSDLECYERLRKKQVEQHSDEIMDNVQTDGEDIELCIEI
jgi:hypothetical protein